MSWIIRDKETKRAVLEVFTDRLLSRLNTRRYEAVPTLQHLQEINQENANVRDRPESPGQ